ncbi:hypothetical protein NMY3_03161 [Candidatus Nitrosocosmicus oleophilus]|uniref:Uncharacterized protein n=1 Tax=Candidatus Nitrosocosmicus oleophilus TaxID=1353260 RepID=A0A654M3X5_9ARCH|nr:hypothetical protein [Candidatus Nitrosocosmicus oleophilus]ALI37346.1 hypothetical protein NMY3_03161 [Candidatus Nitrosocosmicus oleophilus]
MQSNTIFCKNPTEKLVLIVTLSALGLLLQSFAGSWDATSHLIKTPETFFTPPHLMLYTGIGFTLIAFLGAINFEKSRVVVARPGFKDKAVVEENPNKKIEIMKIQNIKVSLRLLIAGTIVLLSGAPLDFFWHRLFGNDGLLSPPHLVVITGMLIINIGAIIACYWLYQNNRNSRGLKGILISLFGTLWYISTWYVYFFALPFSKGHSLNFNPDPMVAAIIGTICIPLITSIIFVQVCKVFNKTGTASTVALIVIGITVLGSILPASSFPESMVLIPVYVSIAIIPILIADYIANYSVGHRNLIEEKNSNKKINFKNLHLFLLIGAGIIVGLTYYTFNFPMLTIVFIKLFGLPVTIDNLANNFIDSLTFVGQYNSNMNLILIFTMVGGIMGALGTVIVLKANSIYNSSKDISKFIKIAKPSWHLPK